MKYLIDSRQSEALISDSDTVPVIDWNSRKALLDLGHKYPDKEFNLTLTNADIDERELANANVQCHNNLIVAVSNADSVAICKKTNVRFYFASPISTYQQLQSVIETGAYMALITAPLTHDLEHLRSFPIKTLAVLNNVNVGSPVPLASPASLCGPWFRPEDAHIYTRYIDYAMFSYDTLRQERGLFNLYNNIHSWHGDLKDIIIGLDTSIKNTSLTSGLCEKRLNCKQICFTNPRSCHYCEQSRFFPRQP